MLALPAAKRECAHRTQHIMNKDAYYAIPAVVMVMLSTVISLSIMISSWTGAETHALYFLPLELPRGLHFPVIVTLVFALPFVLFGIAVAQLTTRPLSYAIPIFLIGMAASFVTIVGRTRPQAELMDVCQLTTAIVLALSAFSIVEVALRGLLAQRLVSLLTFPVAITYWFITLGIVAAL